VWIAAASKPTLGSPCSLSLGQACGFDPSLVVGLLFGGIGVGLGIAAVAFDRRRLMKTLIRRSSPRELAELRRQIDALGPADGEGQSWATAFGSEMRIRFTADQRGV
jgi:hypothetical protein